MKCFIALMQVLVFNLVSLEVLAQQQELILYDYEGYVNHRLIAKFEQESGIKVTVKTFTGMPIADDLVRKSKDDFDLIAGTHYILEGWIKNNKIMPLDFSLLPNYTNLNKEFLQKLNVIDKGNKHVVPYISGIAMLALNKNIANAIWQDDVPNTWGLIFNEKYAAKLAQCGIALGQSPLQTYSTFVLYKAKNLKLSESYIKKITNEMLQLKPYYRYANNAPIVDDLKSGKICAAFGWSSFNQIDEITLLEPIEGMPMYIDVWAIPAHAKNAYAAHSFIDFTMRPENAAEIAKHSKGIIAVNGAADFVDTNLAQNKLIFPDDKDVRRMYLFQNLNDEQKNLMLEEWSRFNKF